MHAVKWAFLLSGFWLLLSGFYQPLLLSFGIVSVLLVLYVLKRMDAADKEPRLVSTGYRMGLYSVWLTGEIAKSSLHVVKLVWGNPKDLEPALAKIPVNNIPEKIQVLYANSITLTPGTLSVDLEDGEITVHALQAKSIKALKDGDMEKHIKRIWGGS